MKRFLLLAGALFLMVSCTDELNQMINGSQSGSARHSTLFHASTEGPAAPATKVYADENMKVLWNANDYISIFDFSTYNYQYLFTGDDGDTAGDFEDVTPSGYHTGQTVDYAYAAYPYSKNNKLSNSGVFTMELPAEQAYKERSFGIGANTMVAITDGSFLAFKNVGGYLSLRLYGDDVSVSRITIKGNNGEKIAGKASIAIPFGGTPTVTMDEESATDEVSIVCDPAVKIGTNANSYTDFWFVIPPMTFSKGFTITVTEPEGGVFEKSTTKSFTVSRNKLDWMSALKVVPVYEFKTYVDMGTVVDGKTVYWGKCNLGATREWDYGDYFAWGEISPKSSYTESNYDYSIPFGDAATAYLGEGWRTPTKAEWEALLNSDNYTWEWTTEHGVNGSRVTSKVPGSAGNSIFLPAAGNDGNINTSTYGFYWSSTLDESDSRWAFAVQNMKGWSYYDFMKRFQGFSIRPIYDSSSTLPVPPEVPVTGVSFEGTDYVVLNGGTSALTANVSPANATIKELTWTSSNPSVAIVGPTGVVTGQKTGGTTTITARTVDGGYTATCKVTVVPSTTYVNMGDGTRWAIRNVGAARPEDFGNYYAWGETSTKSVYSWDTYTYTIGTTSQNPSKYNSTDGKTVLDPEDDAATANWGETWRMPTDAELTWLAEHCTWTVAIMNGVEGYLVKSNVSGYSSAMIFLPYTGVYSGNHLTTNYSAYWSSTLSSNVVGANRVRFTGTGYAIGIGGRYVGYPVRPVYEPHLFINGHEYVEMGDGLKWATCNVGADSPEGYGNYFAWGETSPKSNYAWDTYFDNPDGDGKTFTKYALGKKTVLELTDDAARQKWGGTWRIPTVAEWTALMDTDHFDWVWDDTRKGFTVVSKIDGYVGNSIFLPAAGDKAGSTVWEVGESGSYWSSSLSLNYSTMARNLLIFGPTPEDIADFQLRNNYRYAGYSVRPVSE